MLERIQYLELITRIPFQITAETNAKLRVDNLKFSAGRTLAETDAGKFGLTLGASLTKASWSLTSTNPNVLASAGDEGLLLLPSLGFFSEWHPSKHTTLSLRADYFALKLDQSEGQSYTYQGLVEYRPTPTLSLGLGYGRSSLDVRVHKRDYDRDFSLGHGGPYLSLRYAF